MFTESEQEITYFNPLFFHNLDTLYARNFMNLLLQNRSAQTYNPTLACISESLNTDYRTPDSLRTQCLKFLHANFAYKRKIEGKLFVNFSKAPALFLLMCIPNVLKDELVSMGVNCPVHVILIDLIKEIKRPIRIIIKKDSKLFKILVKDPRWKKRVYFIWNPTQLIDALIRTGPLRGINTSYQMLQKYVRRNCIAIS